ncbi:MAG: sigma-70 family RNA polymerase sigma factor [Lachnospiraceae bacterium]
MEINKSSMLKIAYHFFSNEEDVADVMQQTILDAYEHLPELKKNKYFKTWLLRILINNCTEIYNMRKKYVSETAAAEKGYDENYFSENNFRTILSFLKPKDQIIFQLYYGEEYTTKDIAGILSMKEATVRSRIHRGKESLRKQLREEEV